MTTWEKDAQHPDGLLRRTPWETKCKMGGSENPGSLSETDASGNRVHTQKVIQNVNDRLKHDEDSIDMSMYSGR